ncbi:MAG: hypothetical protein US53_C0052G0001, partial [Candidatus Woesebacteria bacterium GW2011_GWA1_37_7]
SGIDISKRPYRVIDDELSGLRVEHYDVLDLLGENVGQIYLVRAEDKDYRKLLLSETYK